MSDMATSSRLAPAVSQLPVDWYFDERIYALEKKLIFDAGPGYVGHQLMVPEAGDCRTQEWKDHGQMLLNGGAVGPNAGIWQMSHVCRHRQAIMLQGAGKLEGPLHPEGCCVDHVRPGHPARCKRDLIRFTQTALTFGWEPFVVAAPHARGGGTGSGTGCAVAQGIARWGYGHS